MKFEVKNRFTGDIQFTAEIECAVDALPSLKLGLAVKWALKEKADLRDANLRDADLSGANLRGADLSGADLRDADLRSFKSDLWMTLTQNRNEVPALVAALKEGRVDGSTYSGECACLVGTIANAKHVSADTLEKNVSNPAEKWFLMIKKGDKPGDDTSGGFASKMALDWALEWCALNNIEIAA